MLAVLFVLYVYSVGISSFAYGSKGFPAAVNRSWRTAPSRFYYADIVVGIFCTAREKQARMAIRETWTNSTLVCTHIDSQRRTSAFCRIIYVFVIGHSEYDVDEEIESHGDLLLLEGVENMNEGKTYDFFRAVFNLHPGIMYFAKTDADTYVNATSLVSSLLTHTSPYVYFGHENSFFSCGGADSCPRDWQYMSGQFYALGNAIVRWLVANSHLHHRYGHEDLEIGRTIQQFSGPLLYYPCNRRGIQCPFVHNVKNYSHFYDIHSSR
jgi:Galactosyltransferase